MYSARIERLEERKMFSVTDLILDPFDSQVASPATTDQPLALVGDFNGDGKDDLATIKDGSSNTLIRVDTSPMRLSIVSLDTWEHAYSFQARPDSNGIIAVLIGLTADPSDPSGNTLKSATFAFADGSVRRVPASLIASDEYFSQFTNTTLDDEALMATTFGRGIEQLNLTHDAEFEKWASMSRFDRG